MSQLLQNWDPNSVHQEKCKLMVGAKVCKQENTVTTFIFVVLENCCPFEESIHAASKQLIYFSDIKNPNIYLTSLFPAITPSLPARPVITPELIGHSVYLRCSFIPPPWSQALGFQVVWARHIGHNMKVELRQESVLKPFSLVEMDGIHFRLGETVISTRLSWSYDEGSTCGRLYHSSRKREPRLVLNSFCSSASKSKSREAMCVIFS